jgi:hypothetical protein
MLNRTNHQTPIKRLIKHLADQENSAKDLVEILLARQKSTDFEYKNCFQTPEPQDFDVFSNPQAAAVHKAEKHAWPLIGGCLNHAVYLPIRAFRGDAERLWRPVDKLRIFRSSGTNSGTEGRSWSAFTAEGLRFYKAASLTAFLSVLERLVLPFSGEFLNMAIISLIPPVEKWPDSSLAQMVSWFREVWLTEYADAVSPDCFQQVVHKVATNSRPVCIFGTAFHFVNFLDKWQESGLPPFRLPAGSILVETGGTKGLSRSVERSELYKLMARAFDVNEAVIISEYGMCELASQAWDFLDTTEASTSLSKRNFRFPWWVKLAVMTHPSICSSSDEGALVVQDFARIDLSSSKGTLPIQTEDLADLASNGSFFLKGRVPNAPLKGCSMRAEESAVEEKSARPNQQVTRSTQTGPAISLTSDHLRVNAQKAREWFDRLCIDSEARRRLLSELQSEWLASAALEDLVLGKPTDDGAFIEAAKNSCSNQNIAKRWLFIAPASHSIAMIHPILAALTLGLEIRVRVPIIANIPSDKTFLDRALELAREHNFKIETLREHWRLGSDDLQDGEHVLIFGDDETCHWAESFAPGRVKSFGHATSLTIALAEDFNNSSNCAAILRDQLALRQRGCLSSRMILVVGGDGESLRRKFELSLPMELKTKVLSPAERSARSMEIVRLEQLGFKTDIGQPAGCLDVPLVIMAHRNAELETLSESLFAALSRLDLVIPVLILPETTDKIALIRKLPKPLAVKAISCSEQLGADFKDLQKNGVLPKNLRFVRHGTLDAPLFDGRHLGSCIFAGSV